jgi:kinesin family protein C1
MDMNVNTHVHMATQEASICRMQVVALQDINKRLQEYNTSLQTYNSKLQTDAAAVAENLCRIQKEKSTMVETLSSLRGQNAALQEQLTQSKVD